MNAPARRVVLGVLACLLLAGCRAGLSPTPAPIALDGTQWILTSIEGQAPLEGGQATLDFADGKLGGTTGCNFYGAPYILEGSRLKIELLEQTVMLCEQPAGVMDQEAHFMKVLGDAALHFPAPFRVIEAPDGRRLEIDNNLGAPVLEFIEKRRFAMDPADLRAKTWRLVSLNGAPPDSGDVLLNFLDDREYFGFAGCRHYFGSYQAEDDTIRFSSTFMLGEDCHENEALNLQEGLYTDGLSRTGNFRLDADRLDLLTERGGILSFLADPVDAGSLVGTSWRLRAFLSRPVNAQEDFRIPNEPLLQTEITLRFNDERVSGSAGCNTYQAGYSTDGITINLQAPATTRKLCSQPENIMQQEQFFLRQLEKSITYIYVDEQLLLNTGDGHSLFFDRAP